MLQASNCAASGAAGVAQIQSRYQDISMSFIYFTAASGRPLGFFFLTASQTSQTHLAAPPPLPRATVQSVART